MVKMFALVIFPALEVGVVVNVVLQLSSCDVGVREGEEDVEQVK